jgi:hypothetical protein
MTDIVNTTNLTTFYIGSVLFLSCQLAIGKRLLERLMSDHIAENSDSTAKIYFQMTNSKQWHFIGCIYSLINPFILVALAIISTCSCNAPILDGKPQTFFTSDECLTTSTVWHYRSLAFYIAYCTVDTVNCVAI